MTSAAAELDPAIERGDARGDCVAVGVQFGAGAAEDDRFDAFVAVPRGGQVGRVVEVHRADGGGIGGLWLGRRFGRIGLREFGD